MGQRIFHKLTLVSNAVSTEVEETAPGRTIAERWDELLQENLKRLPGKPMVTVYAVLCDGCGLRVEVERPELPEGWISDERGELCPTCPPTS